MRRPFDCFKEPFTCPPSHVLMLGLLRRFNTTPPPLSFSPPSLTQKLLLPPMETSTKAK